MSSVAEPVAAASAAPAARSATLCDPAIVVVGCGPVGVRFVHEFRRFVPRGVIRLFGAEESLPYNRVRLTSVVAGEAPWSTLGDSMGVLADEATDVVLGCRIVAIDRRVQTVRDAFGRTYGYDRLVLATGSTPHVPAIDGIALPGVFTFRDLGDAQRLVARRIRSRHTVVIGGGLLGLEAARAMNRHATRVTVVEHVDRLMPQQLDAAAAALVREEVERRGIRVVVGDSVRRIEGVSAVEGVLLRSGESLACDTIVVATGIRPNIGLAREAGLAVGLGIRVDDRLRTSDPCIHAIGECAEHRGRVHGLVAPGYEQAAVAAHVIAGGEADYRGSVAAARLKVVGCQVFSVGEAGTDGLPDLCSATTFRDERNGIYRKIVVRRGRAVGALAVGPWAELSRVQEAVVQQRRIAPWTRLRFAREGRLAREVDSPGVASWHPTAVVCNCTGVTRGRLGEAMAQGACTAAQLCAATGASSVCGSCRPLVEELAGSPQPRVASRGAAWLAGLGVAGLASGLALAALPSLPYSATADLEIPWDRLWRDGTAKQASGYTLLALMVVLSTISLRKRLRRVTWLPFAGWRFFHAALGLLAAIAIVVHTGGRMGENLVFTLAALATFALASGGALGAVTAFEHRLRAPVSRRWRAGLTWAHVLALWPLPVLLGFHIVQAYWF